MRVGCVDFGNVMKYRDELLFLKMRVRQLSWHTSQDLL